MKLENAKLKQDEQLDKMKKVYFICYLVIRFQIIKNWAEKKGIWRNENVKNVWKSNTGTLTPGENKRSHREKSITRGEKEIWLF